MLLFSHDIFASQRAGGVSRCMIELMREIDGLAAPFSLVIGEADNEMIAAERDEPWLRRRVVRPQRPATSLAPLRNELALRKLARNRAIVHRTYHPRVDLLPRRARVVETLHDLWDQLHGGASSLRATAARRLKQRALRRADAIVCVSRATQAQLETLWPDLAARSVVIHHGVRPFPAASVIGAGDETPYFLYVGRRDLYKNFDVVLRALSRSVHLAEFSLACFGGGVFSESERARIELLGLGGRIRFVHGDDARLGGLYRGATALVYPSRHEGFGLPLLEAMVAGCPALTTPRTSLPEVAGEAALFAEPDDDEAWTHNLETIAYDQELQARLISAGYERAQRFSWRASAAAHLTLYASLH